MASDKVQQAKESMQSAVEKTKEFGQEKTEQASSALKGSEQPSDADQVKEKAASVEESAKAKDVDQYSEHIKNKAAAVEEKHADQTTSGPSVTDQAKEKLEAGKDSAASGTEKVKSTVADTWNKTKEAVSDLNTYPDKK